MINDLRDKIIVGDCFETFYKIPNKSINLTICSPPYFQQRTYTEDIAEIGREENPEEYLDNLIKIFEHCIRVTSDNGSIVFNLGDKYINGKLSLLPFRFAFKAQEENDVMLINNITWIKSNPTPRQFQRRMVSSTEPFFHFVKSKQYVYNLEQEPDSREPQPDTKVGQGYYKQIEMSSLTDEQKELANKELDEVIKEVKEGKLKSLRMKIKGIHSLPFGGQEGGRKTQIENKGFSIIKVPGRTMQKDIFECPVENIRGIGHPAIYPQSIIEHFISLTKNMRFSTYRICCRQRKLWVNAKQLT